MPNYKQPKEWKIAKRATNFNNVYIPEGCIYKTFSPHTIKGQVFPACCVFTTDFDAVKNREHITIRRVVNGRILPPEYVDANRGLCKGIKAFASTLDLDSIKIKPQILRRDITPIGPHDRKVGPYMQRGRRDNTSCFEGDLVTNRCKVGVRTYSNEMYENMVMGVK